MGNCLKTQLKEAVSNNNLLPIGGFYVTFKHQDSPNANSRLLRIAFVEGEAVAVKIVEGSGHFTDSTLTQDLGTEINPIVAGVDIYVSNHDCKVLVLNKYAIYNFVNLNNPANDVIGLNVSHLSYLGASDASANKDLYLRGSGINGNIAFLNGSTIGMLDMRGANVSGDISNIVFTEGSSSDGILLENTNISGTLNISGRKGEVNIYGTSVSITTTQFGTCDLQRIDCRRDINVSGNIADIANGNDGLTTALLYGTSVTGALESLLEAYWGPSHSKRDGTIVVQLSSGCTFNGNNYTTNLYCIFGTNSITVRNNSATGDVYGTYDGSTWTYNN